MYFGKSGLEAIPDLVSTVIKAVLKQAGFRRECRVEVELVGKRRQEIGIRFSKLARSPRIAIQPERWWSTRQPMAYPIGLAAAAATELMITLSSGGRTWELVTDNGCLPSVRSRRARRDAPDLSIHLKLDARTFGTLNNDGFHRLCGILCDHAALHSGVAVSLQPRKPGVQRAWQYPGGLTSYLEELDHSRFPLHPGKIEVAAVRDDMRLELVTRFVHAGIPTVRSWVNFGPTQGGAHLEGFADALEKLFPDSTHGCREVTFVANADTGRQVLLPHPFVAALHLRMDSPRYSGPTKDILDGVHVREFIRDTCSEVLAAKWEELRSQRRP